MKVKCVKTSLDKESKYIINSDLTGYLLIDTIFWVFGVKFTIYLTYVYIFNGNHIFEVPMELFEILEDKVSSEWHIRVHENGETTLWPDLFYQEEFIENFADRESKERSLFEGLRLKIEK